jgi:hypothetical protein
MPPSVPVIVVPGVTATYLRDLYPLPPETIWTVIGKDFERVQMHPDNTRYLRGSLQGIDRGITLQSLGKRGEAGSGVSLRLRLAPTAASH